MLIGDVLSQELGGITGVFAPDKVTHAYINGRARKGNKPSSVYFQADEEAGFAATFEIDLSQVESFIALYPSPDNAVTVTEKIGMTFDGYLLVLVRQQKKSSSSRRSCCKSAFGKAFLLHLENEAWFLALYPSLGNSNSSVSSRFIRTSGSYVGLPGVVYA